jgi:hypothetical protein
VKAITVVIKAMSPVIQPVIVAMTRPFGPPGAPVMPGLSKRAEAPTVGCEKLTRVGCGPGVKLDCVGSRVGATVFVASAVSVGVAVSLGVRVGGGPLGVFVGGGSLGMALIAP